MTADSSRQTSRATRAAGKQTRSAILDAAAALFAERGLGGVTHADIARAADVFPSQVTYYFGGKEELFVEAACRDMLHAAERVEHAAARARTPKRYVETLVETALGSPELPGFVEAALLVRRRPDLAPLVSRTFDQLHREGERAVGENLEAHGWRIHGTPAHEAHGFWATILGVAVEQTARAGGPTPETRRAAVLFVLNLYAEPEPPSPRGG